MQKVQEARRRVFRFLYQSRIQEPKVYFSREDLAHMGDEALVDAAVRFGKELGYLRDMRGSVQLTAEGMVYVESHFKDA